MAVTGHPLTVQVAAQVLERGGNAVDAGVAAGLASNVVQVDMCNLGGIAPILVRRAGDSEVTSIAGVGRWSSTVTVDSYTARHGTAMEPGCAASIVPAALGAWLCTLDRFGTLSFADVAAPAIELASEGFVLDATVAGALDLFAWIYERWPSSAAVYCANGRRPRPGDRLVQKDLGRLLLRLAESEVAYKASAPQTAGEIRSAALDAVRREFYEGEVARVMADFVTCNGGFLTTDDLAEFRAVCEVAPSKHYSSYGGLTVHVTPPQWSQGPALLQALGILEHFDLAGLGHNSAGYLHLLLETVKLSFSDREHHYGDSSQVDLDFLIGDEHCKELATMIAPTSVLDDLPTMRHRGDQVLSTTHISVVDKEGTVFVCAPSDPLAMSPVVPGLGIIVSGRGVQSRTDPAHRAALGQGRRPRVTPAPAIVIDSDSMPWAVSCPGGDVIVQAILQVLLNVSVFSMTEQQATEAARAVSLAFPDSFHPHTHHAGLAAIENRVPEAVMEELVRIGHDVREWPPFEFEAGSVGLIRQHRSEEADRHLYLRAGADPRRAAYALGR